MLTYVLTYSLTYVATCQMSASCLDVVAEFDEHWASQIRQRKFQMHNKEWLEVIDEDEAEEYEDAVALNNAMSHLQLNQPLDASQLDDDGKCRVLVGNSSSRKLMLSSR